MKKTKKIIIDDSVVEITAVPEIEKKKYYVVTLHRMIGIKIGTKIFLHGENKITVSEHDKLIKNPIYQDFIKKQVLEEREENYV